MISHAPDKTPAFSPELATRAEALRMHLINVICDEPGAQVGDAGGVSFFAIVPFIPRIGERLELEGRRLCVVRRVYHKVTKQLDPSGRAAAIHLVPNVLATLIPPLEKRRRPDQLRIGALKAIVEGLGGLLQSGSLDPKIVPDIQTYYDIARAAIPE